MRQSLFSQEDLKQIAAHGLTEDLVHAQLATFKNGIPFTTLCRPCTPRDGMTVLRDEELPALVDFHNQAAAAGRVSKFVPASGAASRMFQTLLQSYHNEAVSDRNQADLTQFFVHLEQFAFSTALWEILHTHGLDLATCLTQRQYRPILKYLLTPAGLNYANLPKALLPFHRYPDHCRTPLEEHLIEAAAYAQDCKRIARVHFTVALEHETAVKTHLEHIKQRYERTGVRYDITWSCQHPSTDTIAVNPDHTPFRDPQDHLRFRPGGHGALLKNLQDLSADIVFVKNIDNVVPDRLKDVTYTYKKALGGYLVMVQRQIFAYLEQLETGDVDAATFREMCTFAQQKLAITLPETLGHVAAQERCRFLAVQLNRPLRVCGMVRNVGEPGGGPFWTGREPTALSLQIVEASQVDLASAEQRTVLAAATHFNPVDLVCGVRDYRGRPFDLMAFVDPETGFISQKTQAGKPLQALELPGLWNGAMAHWNTIFVEVPLITFNPVKTVLDLLRPEHQP